MARAARRSTGSGLQLPLFAPESAWSPPSMDSLPSWASAPRVALDIETRDEHLRELGIGVRRGGYITGVSFAIEDGPAHYLPMRHEGGDNLDQEQVLRYLRAQIGTYQGIIVGAHLSYDLDYLMEASVDFGQVRQFRDIQIADPLIYELHNSYSLQSIAQRWGLPGKKEEMLRRAAQEYGIDPKRDMWRLPARYVGAYAEADCTEPLLALRRQEKEIDDRDLWNIFNLECDVLPVLVKMRRRGVRIDQDQLAHIERWSLKEETDALAFVKRETGVAIQVGDVWKPEALAPALRELGVSIPETAQGKASIRKDVLAEIKHPVANKLAWARKVNKLRTTFAASVRRYMVKGRIHCTFNQIARESDEGDMEGARYGRLSCVDPNLQQQPARDEFSRDWRKIYLPDEGGEWGANDYSQQEPRWTTHFAAVMNLPGARAAAQAYHDDPKLDNHQFMADLTGLPRKHAKNVYLGLCYGEGGAKLARDLGLPTRWALASGKGRERRTDFFDTRDAAINAKARLEGDGYVFEAAGEEAQHVLDTFDNRAPFIRQLSREAQKVAAKRGYIITGGGRHLHFPQKPDGSYDWTHKALNRLIQGTSADQTKKAVVALDRAGHYLQLQVHDEIDGTIGSREEGEQMSKIMRDVMPALVPFKVDLEIGKSWGDSMG